MLERMDQKNICHIGNQPGCGGGGERDAPKMSGWIFSQKNVAKEI